MSGEWGNHDRREQPARFTPAQGEPRLCWPKKHLYRDYRPDTINVTGESAYDVPSDRQPAWALAEISAAMAEGRAVVARKVGSAGKYRFWELLGGSLDGHRKLVETFSSEFTRQQDEKASSLAAEMAAHEARKAAEIAAYAAKEHRYQAELAARRGLRVTETRVDGRDPVSLAVSADGTRYQITGGSWALEAREIGGPVSLEALAEQAGMIVIDGVAYDDAMTPHRAAYGALEAI